MILKNREDCLLKSYREKQLVKKSDYVYHKILHVMVSASDIIVLQILDQTTFFNVFQGETGFKKVEKMNNVLIH